ncbi:MAG: lactate utilization protein [Bacteroidales bacterium]|nr:lactate utilization protein [Bacteroidales bacterium]
MKQLHKDKAREFLRNKDYARWHDETFWSVRSKRDAMASSLPEWETLREKASAIKRHTLTHLDEYLEQFTANAEKNGAIVHWAADAAEFNDIVLGILHEHGVHKLVKSKSMLTEECEMNPFLESKGIEVVETDLGERIIQLKGQKPSHIVMPAIHLNHDDVGELFEEKGISNRKGDHDPTYLTQQARISLRGEFLSADAGMTGANFAVASTGDVVVCTNEGNADMATSCPKLHIVAMGLEKIVPDYDSLAVFHRLLARCGTGQCSTTYTSHFRTARPGASPMHIILVDNGRSSWIGNPDHWESLKCIRCGACMNTCPVYRRSGGYSYSYFIPGPIGINLGMLRDPREHAGNVSACTQCMSCQTACPVKVDLGEQIYRWRQELGNIGKANPFKLALSDGMSLVFGHPGLYKAVTAPFRPFHTVFKHLEK